MPTQDDFAVMPARVLVALMHGTTEEKCIASLADMPSRVLEHRNRATLLGRLRTYRPTALLLPLRDRRAYPSSLLVGPCLATLPRLRIVIVSDELSHSRHLLQALRCEATVLVQPSREQLRSVVLGAAFQATPQLPTAEELFRSVSPPFLRRLLEAGWMMADQGVGLSRLAAHLGTSTRTLERETVRQKLSHPREILAAIRFLRTYALAAAMEPDTMKRHFELAGDGLAPYEPSSPLPPLLRAVAHRVRALGGSSV